MTDQDCHAAGPGQRALGPRHKGDHDDCQPCPERHCTSCAATHVRAGAQVDDPGDITCPRCIGRTRADIADIAALHSRLEDEATHHPNAEVPGGTATLLLGAVSLGYTLEQTRRIITAVDQAAARGELLTDEALAKITADDPWPSDPIPPLFVLATWEDTWREHLQAGPGPSPATVDSAAEWLSTVLHRIAQHDDWAQFATEIRTTRSLLETVLREGTRPALGVPCLNVGCGARLRQTYADPDPCTHDTPAKRLPRQLVRDNITARGAIAALGYPEHLGYPAPVPHTVGAIRAALRLARRPCEQTDCDQGGRRSRWQCPVCKRSYDQLEYSRAKAHHSYRARVA